MMPTVDYNYQIFVPSGNDTAIVFGMDYTDEEKKHINDTIMKTHRNVEQVGFVSASTNRPVFFMAGGGFCGNGTRSAVYHLLQGKTGKISLTIPDVVDNLQAGISEFGYVWTNVPLQPLPTIEETTTGFYIVKLPGVSHVIVPPQQSLPFLRKPAQLKRLSQDILITTGLLSKCSCGVIFTEEKDHRLNIFPVVHDYGVDTMVEETACGSGTIAVAIQRAIYQQKSQILHVYQPSGMQITAEVKYANGQVVSAKISGKVTTDGRIYRRTLSIGK